MLVIKDGVRVQKERAVLSPPVSAAEAARLKAHRGLGQLYKPRTPIHPKLAHGKWRNIKWAMMAFTLGVYYITPWLRWERPGALPDQAILVDVAHGRFWFFGIHLWPQEIHFLTGLLVMAALALFLVSALFGRLWCGYSCPQTIWTDLFIMVERAFEGDRNARLKLDAERFGFNKAWRKGGKHLVWLLIAFWTGGAWTLYFQDAPTLVHDFWTGQAKLTAYISFVLLTATTYSLAGLMREQVCFYLCPWPRIQGAMLDKDSLQVTYRYDRGEPRGPHKKNQSWEGRGDCIDCNQCVVVCPMGIDIRDGPQFECINCGLCIDACNEVMAKVGRPKGLIAYDSDAAVAFRSRKEKPKYRLARPRTVIYAGALAAISCLMLYGLVTRDQTELHALRDRNPVFVTMKDGSTRDGYTLKLSNRTLEPKTYAVTVEGVPGAVLKMAGGPQPSSSISVEVPPDTTSAVRVFVTAPPDEEREPSLPIVFTARAGDLTARAKATFQSSMGLVR